MEGASLVQFLKLFAFTLSAVQFGVLAERVIFALNAEGRWERWGKLCEGDRG